MIVPEDKLLARFATADIASFFQNEFRKNGVKLILNESVKGFHGRKRLKKLNFSQVKS
jgi:NADPH-dependent 2,4-dienoyl-CoA reductase/sulfur reductase-like enzyme